MQPVVTVAEMAALDQEALATVSREVLVRRAGYAVAAGAIDLLGGVSGTRVAVLAGKGSNGADGRIAAAVLTRRGARCSIVEPTATAAELAGAALVIDAAYGTGLRASYEAPRPPEGALVVAVDLPSGLDGDTGERRGEPMEAALTVTMAAPKLGLLLGDGPSLAGAIRVADIGIDVHDASLGLLEDADLSMIPPRAASGHKWSRAVTVVAGSQGMEGAAVLSSLGALKAGSGMVRLVTVAAPSSGISWPAELVRHHVTADELVVVAAAEQHRAKAMVVGPGLGRTAQVAEAIRTIVATRQVPVVLDADGLAAFSSLDQLGNAIDAGTTPVVLTPHDGELQSLLGRSVRADRIGELRSLAAGTGAVVLHKGSTTVVTSPSATAPTSFMVTAGTSALATAGTGDVLSGVIAALLSTGLDAPQAAALGAHLHGRAGACAAGTLVAAELPDLVGLLLEEVHGGR